MTAKHRKIVKVLKVMGCLLSVALAMGSLVGQAGQSKGLSAARMGWLADVSAAQTPTVIQAEKSDTSPPLRSMEVILPQASGEIREIPLGKPVVRGSLEGNQVDPVVQRTFGGDMIPDPIQNFEGINNVNGVLPPDTNGDVGPNHYVQMVNDSFAIWDKSGNLLYGPVNNNTLWQGFGGPCENDNSGDPVVLYDPLADRWMLTQFAVQTGSHECIAISQTGDPLGAFHRYAFNIGGFPDYPKLGVWSDAYYATFRNFGVVFDMQAVAFNRAKMLIGDPTAEAVIFSISEAFPNLSVDGFLPVDLDGPAPPAGAPGLFAGYLADERGFDGDYLALFEMSVDWADPGSSTFSDPLLLATAPFDSNLCGYFDDCIPQPDTIQELDSLSIMTMFRLAYRNFGFYQALSVTHTVDVGNDHAGKRWYELRNAGNGWGIYQQGTYAPDGEHRWMGSIAMDAAGNLALGYSVSSSSVYPSIRYTGRLVSDLLGSMPQGEGEIIAGSGSQLHTTGRWGDYSAMTVDPTDECTFWYTTEYIQTTGSAPWQTRIASFKFDACPNPAVNDFTLWAQPSELAVCAPDLVSYDVTAFAIGNYSDQVTLSASGVPDGYEASFTPNPVTPPANTVMSLTNSGAAAAGSYELILLGEGPTQTHTTTVTLDLFTEPPGAPTLTNPVDGAVNQSVRPLLQWAEAPFATSYFVEVASDPGFTNIVDSKSVPTTSYQVATRLDFDTTYYWRVTAENPCGSGVISQSFSFTTIGDTIVCPAGTGLTTAYLDDFDPDAAGWTHDAIVGPDTWVLNPNNPSPGSGGNSWYSLDYGSRADQQLMSPAIALPDEAVLMLQFWNEQNFENPPGPWACWDGGLLEISTDGGVGWIQLNAELLNDPYDGIGNNGPPAGLELWCGGTIGIQPWTNSIVDLSGYAGQDVNLRFRNVSDAFTGAEGWYIDDVQVTYCAQLQSDIAVDPTAISETLEVDQSTTAGVTIGNQGNADLEWAAQEAVDEGCEATDLPWVSVDPASGTTLPGESDMLLVTLDAGDLEVGPYSGVLCLSSNDPDEPQVMVSLELLVNDEPISGLAAANDSPTVLGQATTLTATVESGTNVSYAWDFGDGTTGMGAIVSHIYAAAGTYAAVVTATNSVSELSASTVVMIVPPGWQQYLPLVAKP